MNEKPTTPASASEADIDSIALEVANRFGSADPQRRARLQVAVIEAIKRAAPHMREGEVVAHVVEAPYSGKTVCWHQDVPLGGKLYAAPPKADAVDLEQFRPAVQVWKVLAGIGEVATAMPMQFLKSEAEYTAQVTEADRLLAIIDSSRSKP